MWLLARGKDSKAHRNLSRLRGKVSYEKCENEFREMVLYNTPVNNGESSNITNLRLHTYYTVFYFILYTVPRINTSSHFYRLQKKNKCLETTCRARSTETSLFNDDILFLHEFTVWSTVFTVFSSST